MVPPRSAGMEVRAMDWLLLATGFTGALTAVFLLRQAQRSLVVPPSVETHFSPGGNCTEAILREIGLARREVLVQAYSFTSREISQALIDAKMRGVHVEIILDHSNEKEPHTELPFLIEQGLAPLVDHEHAIAHNKVMIVDERTVLTGSFNFTHQAEKSNAENLVILRHHTDLATTYREHFLVHKGHARSPEAKQQQAA
jgi:phosphatidylserine/phosphatidylglycerophosphate/cardiolipin synthase-like enzyme